MRSLEASGKIETSAISASSVAATYASPEVCEPVVAREKRRRYGRCGAIRMDNVIQEAPFDAFCWSTQSPKLAVPPLVPACRNFSAGPAFMLPRQSVASLCLMGWVVKDKSTMNEMRVRPSGRTDEGLGPNSDIGAKLRAFYGAVQDQPIPDKFLDLLEKLDEVEQA